VRDPENELYDCACDLVEAAAGADHDSLRRGLAKLSVALGDAETAAEAARSLAARRDPVTRRRA
jgi:hypothetical protein